jgi:hypothetical protein
MRNLKRNITFAAFRPRTKDVFRNVAIFMPVAKVLIIIGCCLLVGCCFLKVSTVLGRTNEGNSLFYAFVFQHEMTKNVKDASRKKYSNEASTPTERNTVSCASFKIEMDAKNTAVTIGNGKMVYLTNSQISVKILSTTRTRLPYEHYFLTQKI